MINATNIIRSFSDGPNTVRVLKGITVHIPKGQFVAIMGRSGAGKSTLMYQLSLLDEPTDGTIEIDGTKVSALSEEEKTAYRLKNLGYVFQDYALLPELTALENTALPLLMRGTSQEDAYRAAETVLKRIELAHVASHVPSALSGGQQQRVSIARAVVHNPAILFADEPTANLDSVMAKEVIELFKTLHREGQTIVMVTHEEEYAKVADRVIVLSDGQILSDTTR